MQRVEISEFDKIVLGIDPGTNIMGYGIVGCIGKKITSFSSLVTLDSFILSSYNPNSLKARLTLKVVQPNKINTVK